MSFGDLLTVLTSSMKKKYLSDLHKCDIVELAIVLESLDIEAYTLEQWEYALSYIMGASVSLAGLHQVLPFVRDAAQVQKK